MSKKSLTVCCCDMASLERRVYCFAAVGIHRSVDTSLFTLPSNLGSPSLPTQTPPELLSITQQKKDGATQDMCEEKRRHDAPS